MDPGKTLQFIDTIPEPYISGLKSFKIKFGIFFHESGRRLNFLVKAKYCKYFKTNFILSNIKFVLKNYSKVKFMIQIRQKHMDPTKSGSVTISDYAPLSPFLYDRLVDVIVHICHICALQKRWS